MSVYTIGVVGPGNCGKTQICNRLTSHRFDGVHKETKEKSCYFVRHQQKNLDGVVCLEDTEPSEVLRTEIYSPKFWFESDDNFGKQGCNERTRCSKIFGVKRLTNCTIHFMQMMTKTRPR
jgi:GTPase SAR1 family protein